MTDKEDTMRDETKRMATELIVAYVDQNRITISEFKDLIGSVFAIVDGWDEYQEPPPAPALSKPPIPPPPVPITQTITKDAIICLEDGKHTRRLGFHLGRLGITPAEYRAKWGLPDDYPMVHPDYAAKQHLAAKAYWSGKGKGRPAQPISDSPRPTDPAQAPQPFERRPAPPPPPSQTAIAEKLREAAEANPDAAANLPLSASFAALKAVRRHEQRTVQVEVRRSAKHLTAKPVNSRADMFK